MDNLEDNKVWIGEEILLRQQVGMDFCQESETVRVIQRLVHDRIRLHKSQPTLKAHGEHSREVGF